MGGVGGARGLGSSPLARGLHMRLEKGTVADRIIPARAGFTLNTRIIEHYWYGSSPLARGLRAF